MPTRKQRRRQQKSRRHEYEYVYVDDEGNEVEVDPALMRHSEVRKLWGDSTLLDQLIGPIERIPIEETLRWMLEG